MVKVGRDVPGSTAIPAARKRRAGTRAAFLGTAVPRIPSGAVVRVIIMGLSCTARLLVRICETDSWEKGLAAPSAPRSQ